MSSRRRLRSSALALLALAGPIGAAAPAWQRAGAAERLDVGLGGGLVAALAATPGGPLHVLVRPATEVDGPRRLLAIARDATPRVEELGAGIGGWTKALVAVELADGPQLAAAGLGRLAAFGPLARPDGRERALLEHPGFDLRSLSPGPLRAGVERELEAAEVGAVRLWRPGAAGTLVLASEARLPFAVERRAAGLRLTGLPVVALAADAQGRRRFAVGPEAATAARLRVLLLTESAAGAWTSEEIWLALPAPEEVEESWIVDGDEAPLLVVHTQGAVELNAFEDQLWRLYRLAPDRTRAGRRPELAFTADSKRWHENLVQVVDADGDGRRDLLLARPEGVTGTDLVVERFAGTGGDRFERRSRRDDLDRAPDEALWLADVDGSGRPGLVTLAERELIVWRAAREPRRVLEREPWLRLPLDRGGEAEPPALSLLGVAPRAGAAPDLLVLAVPEKGESRLIVVRPPRP